MNQIKYGLLYKGKVLGYNTQSNSDGQNCCETQYTLDNTEENEWLVDSKIQAEWVRNYSTEWYNAGYDTPTNPYNKEDLKVVEVIREITMTPIIVKIPTFEELAKMKYYKTERNHYDYIMKEKKKHKDLRFNLYDYKKVCKDKEE